MVSNEHLQKFSALNKKEIPLNYQRNNLLWYLPYLSIVFFKTKNCTFVDNKRTRTYTNKILIIPQNKIVFRRHNSKEHKRIIRSAFHDETFPLIATPNQTP